MTNYAAGKAKNTYSPGLYRKFTNPALGYIPVFTEAHPRLPHGGSASYNVYDLTVGGNRAPLL